MAQVSINAIIYAHVLQFENENWMGQRYQRKQLKHFI